MSLMNKIVDKGILYTSCDGGLSVGNNSGKASAIFDRSIVDKIVVIPEKVNQKKVLEIGKNAFTGEKTIEQVIINARIKIIKSTALFGCINLRLITIPNTCETIEAYALDFYDSANNKASEIADIFFEPNSRLKSVDNAGIRNKVTLNLYFCTKMKYGFDNIAFERVEHLNIYATFEMTFSGHSTNKHYKTCI